MKSITLNIFFNDEDSSILSDLGIELDKSLEYRRLKNRPITFYNINAVSTYIDIDEKEYALILSNGSEFICNDSYHNVINKIYILWKI